MRRTFKMNLAYIRTKSLTKIFLLSLFIFFIYGVFWFRKSKPPFNCTEQKNVHNQKSYLTVEILESLIVQGDSHSKDSGGAHVFDIGQVLDQILEDDKKWGNVPMSKEDIKELTNVNNDSWNLLHPETSRPELLTSTGHNPELKYILYWNEAYGSTDYGFCCGQEPFLKSKCPRNDCFATNNRSLIPHEKFDAILFHQRSLQKDDLPVNRSQHQRYIMWMMESAAYPFGFEGSEWNSFFNWTMTYRTDSDFRFAYGKVDQVKDHPKEESGLDDYIESFGRENSHLASGKTKPVAWFVSNCDTQSQREKYAKELGKHIQVDIFGACGDKSCPRNTETSCWDMVEKEYYFYLSFENSICVDYVTEKFFNALNKTVVPIALGGADYAKSAGAPRKSFINAYKDYRDPAALARYMQKLIDDPEMYASHFWWKGYYKVDTSSQSSAERSFCEACGRLHDGNGPKVYDDMEEWWVHKSKCKHVRIESKS